MTHPPTLLVLSPSTGGYYFGALLTGIARELAAVGGRAVVVQTLEPGSRSDELGEAPDFSVPVGWERADGAVSITTAVRGEYLRRLQATGTPVVVASNHLDGLEAPSAVPDNAGGAAAAVEHLVAHGHTRIGFAGNLAQRDVRARHEAYVRTLAAHGLTAEPHHLFVAPDNGEQGGRVAGEAVLREADPPTALVVATDRNALALIDVVTDAGLHVPGDVAVVGFDDIEAASFATPALTTVDQPFDEVGALAARLVLRDAAGGQPRVPAVPHVSPADLVVRSSCGCGYGASATTVDRAVVRRQVAARLRHALVTGLGDRDADVDPLVDDLLDLVDHLVVETDGTYPEREVDALRARLARCSPRPDARRHVTRALDEYVRRTTAAAPSSLVLAVLRDVQAAAFLRQASAVEAMLDEQYGVDAGLFHTRDPRSLEWLAGTHVRGAVLGTWDGEATLRLEGVHDPDGRADDDGPLVPVEQFPPRWLVDAARPEERLMCYVVPVRTRDRHWGMLALVAEIEPSSATETYHHWSALLASALEQQALQAAVHASEERYALVAAAAQDGLWEHDGVAGRTYLSPRARELLGLGDDEPSDRESWRRHVDAEDELRLAETTAAARRSPGTAVELEYRVRDGSGRRRWVLLRALAVADPGTAGEARRVVGSLSDIDRRKTLEEQLRLGALFDEVTGLPNRRLFLDRLGHALERRRRDPRASFAVMFLDLDGFKLVNDSLGHLVGDQLLTIVAERLRAALRTVDTAARLGGDEFAVLLSAPVPDEVLVIAHRIQEAVAQPVRLADHDVSVTTSVGIATSDVAYADPEHVLRDADIAMYEAKSTERGTAAVFDPAMHARATDRLRTRAELRAALAERQLVVHYQPVVTLDGGAVEHLEALVRWQHPERGLLLPGAFLPAMEDNASITALGEQVLEQVCAQVAAWTREHGTSPSVAVNVAHAEFWAADLTTRVRETLARHGVPASRLVLEITESVIMTDPAHARRVMDELHEIGVALHIDDFGTGQSSLHALRHLPVDALKVDGSFVREMADPQTAELVRIVLEIGEVLGLDVVAECVETAEQAERLRALGCHRAQGWLFGRAMPGDDVAPLWLGGVGPAAGAEVPPGDVAAAGSRPGPGVPMTLVPRTSGADDPENDR